MVQAVTPSPGQKLLIGWARDAVAWRPSNQAEHRRADAGRGGGILHRTPSQPRSSQPEPFCTDTPGIPGILHSAKRLRWKDPGASLLPLLATPRALHGRPVDPAASGRAQLFQVRSATWWPGVLTAGPRSLSGPSCQGRTQA